MMDGGKSWIYRYESSKIASGNSTQLTRELRTQVSDTLNSASSRALYALTVQASTTELGKQLQIFTTRAEKNAFVNHNGKNDYAVYSYCLWC